MAIKVLWIISSVVHHFAFGHNISLSGHRTTHLLGNPTFEIWKFDKRFMWYCSKRSRALYTVKIKQLLTGSTQYSSLITRQSQHLWDFRLFFFRIIYLLMSSTKLNFFRLRKRKMNIHIILIASIVHADDLKNAYSFQTIPIFLLPIRKKPKTWFSLSSCEVQILLSYTQFQSCTFWQRYPTTNAQDKSSSVMVWKHLWFPPALRCDLLDAPLSLWWWRNRSCTFSSLKKPRFLKQKPMLSLPLKNWLLFLAILIKALYSFLFVFF